MTAGRMMIGLLSAALVGGCATVPREAGFPDVERAVAERTGGKRVHWNQGTASDAAVAESVNAMLAQELTADEAMVSTDLFEDTLYPRITGENPTLTLGAYGYRWIRLRRNAI